jgi:hypothetical protein
VRCWRALQPAGVVGAPTQRCVLPPVLHPSVFTYVTTENVIYAHAGTLAGPGSSLPPRCRARGLRRVAVLRAAHVVGRCGVPVCPGH